MQTLFTHEFENGLTLIGEEMEWLESVAFSVLMEGGCRYDPVGRGGLASFTSEMAQRGCGDRDSRQFVNDLERLGVVSAASVSNSHSSFGGAMPAERLPAALEIYADLLRRPHLPDDQFEDARQVCLQEVRAAEDDLAQRVNLELRRRQYGDPWGRSSNGTMESVQSINGGDVRDFWSSYYQPQRAILSVAGKLNWPRLLEDVSRLFGDWQPQQPTDLTSEDPQRGYRHMAHDSSQTHIGIAYRGLAYSEEDYFQARASVGVLSDGMSSRLFTEVREKRGLCYSVDASCHYLRDRGAVLCYAGTTTERAQETLDVTIAELRRLAEGIEDYELDRLKARIKSGLIMQQESSSARSGSNAAAWYYLGRLQTLDEVRERIGALSQASINGYLRENPPGDFTVVTLGERELEVPVEVS